MARGYHKNPWCDHCGHNIPEKGDYFKDLHDPCIKNLPGVRHACCGHGVKTKEDWVESGIIGNGFLRPYVSFCDAASGDDFLEYERALAFFEKCGKGPDRIRKTFRVRKWYKKILYIYHYGRKRLKKYRNS